MARIRTIKPEFPHSESLGRVSRDSRLLFVMLWTICDDEGRARANSRMLASLLFPYDDDATRRIPEWLTELERENCIRLYAVDGNAYLHIIKWCVHQKIDKPSKSRLPAPPEKKSRRVVLANAREPSCDAREASSGDLVPRTKDLGMDQESISAKPASPVAVAPLPDCPLPEFLDRRKTKPQPINGHRADFQSFYDAYPVHKARRAAEKAYVAALKRASPELILAGAQRYRDDPDRDPKKSKHPATWLNADCWADDAETATATVNEFVRRMAEAEAGET